MTAFVALQSLALVLSLTLTTEAHRKRQSLRISGTVVGYDELISLANITSAPNAEILIVRVDALVKGNERARYIKVVYKFMQKEARLPSEVFEGDHRWRMTLTKADGGDQTCKGPIQRLKRTPGGEAEQIPDDVTLPCYILRPSALTRAGRS